MWVIETDPCTFGLALLPLKYILKYKHTHTQRYISKRIHCSIICNGRTLEKTKHWLKHSTKPGKSWHLTRDHSTATKRNKIVDMQIYLGRVYEKIINFKKKISEYLYNDSLYIKQKFAYTDTCADINVQIHRKPWNLYA